MIRGQARRVIAVVSCLYCAVACGGSNPAQDPSAVNEYKKAATAPAVSPPAASAAADESAEADPEKPVPKEDSPEPTFTPDMSVEDAIKAIPQSAERLNLDQETLSKPLEEETLYAPCKPGAAHFTLRVAVWRGKAVAIDLTTTPKNPKFAECLKSRIREITWPAKVASLNTVEYSL